MAAKYISHFPKPVLDDLVNGKWLPVIGAGMSLNAVVPKGKKMPLWGDLGNALTAQLADYSPSSVLDGVSAYQHEFDRSRLIEQLSEILLIRDAQPGLDHKVSKTRSSRAFLERRKRSATSAAPGSKSSTCAVTAARSWNTRST